MTAAAADWARTGAVRPPRSLPVLAVILILGLMMAACFAWLGAWQVERRAWKLDLISHTQQRLAAAPVPVPGPAAWPGVSRQHDEYRRVRLTGRFLGDASTLVSASTDDGPGFWLMTPLRDARGFVVLVNRGYVPSRGGAAAARAGTVQNDHAAVVGLLRINEPAGDLLRRNDPATDRWYSRDVAAIAARRGLGQVAPFFVDADATPNPGGYPKGGLTVVAFPNNHLVYAITWFVLMAMSLGATAMVVRHEWRLRAAA